MHHHTVKLGATLGCDVITSFWIWSRNKHNLSENTSLTWWTSCEVTLPLSGCNLSDERGSRANPGTDGSPPRNFYTAPSAQTFRSDRFSVLFRFCPAKKKVGLSGISSRKNRTPLPDNFQCPLCVSVWWWTGNRVFWLGKEEMKFGEEEGAFTDSYRRVRAPDLYYMRITGAGEPIKTCTSLIYWD